MPRWPSKRVRTSLSPARPYSAQGTTRRPSQEFERARQGRLSREQAAAAYEATLKRFYGADTLALGRPLFDVTLLGIGEDGHTASLLPGQPTLKETQRWVVAVIGAMPQPRITLTYPALNSSRDVAFVVTGTGKRYVVARAQAGDRTIP